MEIVVHYPETAEQQALFDADAAKFYAEYVAQYIEKLPCSTEQKIELLDAIAHAILEKSRKGGLDIKNP